MPVMNRIESTAVNTDQFMAPIFVVAAALFMASRGCIEADGDILRQNMSIAPDDEFLRRQTFQADRSTNVDFVGADTDFRA